MSSLFAFLHHLAAFALVSTLVLEFILIKGELDARSARRLQITDMVFGLSAGAVLVVGLLRVFYFEKGAAYYFHNAPFIAKLALFVLVGLLSIIPTIEFLSWSKGLKQGQAPVLGAEKRRRLRSVMHWELVGVVLIVLCAALMARGAASLG
jgi:putative membrane protein